MISVTNYCRRIKLPRLINTCLGTLTVSLKVVEMLRKHIQRDNKLFATPIYEAFLIHEPKNSYDGVLITGIFLSQVGNISLLGAIHTSELFDNADQLLRKLLSTFGWRQNRVRAVNVLRKMKWHKAEQLPFNVAKEKLGESRSMFS